MIPKQILSSKLTIFLLVISLGFLANVKYRQWQVQKNINGEKQSLSDQASTLTKKNNELSQSLSYLSSGNFKERVARQELNLKKDGEVVFNFSEGPVLQDAPEVAGANVKKNNYQKWWGYFIHTP